MFPKRRWSLSLTWYLQSVGEVELERLQTLLAFDHAVREVFVPDAVVAAAGGTQFHVGHDVGAEMNSR